MEAMFRRMHLARKMKKGNDCGFDIQATSSNDLLRKYKIKVENDKSLKEGMQCTSNQRLKTKSQQDIGTSGGNIQKLDTWTQCLEAGNAIGTTKASQAQHKKQDQRKQSLNNIAAVQPTLERSKKGIGKISMQENASCVENNFQRQKSINTPQVQLSIEEPASKGESQIFTMPSPSFTSKLAVICCRMSYGVFLLKKISEFFMEIVCPDACS